MQPYVLGFAFDTTLRTALVRKNRPAWMAGKWNGIGGNVEAGETPRQAMIREFREEAGVSTAPDAWQHFASLRNEQAGFEMHCFVTLWQPEQLDLVRTTESEEICIFEGDVLTRADIDLMPNLCWLMPMSLSLSETEVPALVHFNASSILQIDGTAE